MSRTWKDKPYHLGGQRHKYYIVNNHRSHSKWKREMSRSVRADIKNKFIRHGDLIQKSKYRYLYFD